jgi:hypothetical protein
MDETFLTSYQSLSVSKFPERSLPKLLKLVTGLYPVPEEPSLQPHILFTYDSF